ATDTEMTLEDGDTLLLYTDGLNEAINNQNDFFMSDRFETSCFGA
ncbi:MAG TPA: hypothetical protein DIT99_27820, partial [Candidatus Latescibacteria bacterium]|nr:hypothetical protein [Candidatus Latescibacterota bacterium]